jgi:hypothetical protein
MLKLEIGAVASAVAIAALVFRDMQGSNGKEISWQEFCTTLLESGEVARIIVVNGRTARVVLSRTHNPIIEGGSTGVISGTDGGVADNKMGAARSRFDDARNSDGHDFTEPSTSGLKGNRPEGGAQGVGNGGLGSSGNAGTSVTPYYFTIGSVETFERKLESGMF